METVADAVVGQFRVDHPEEKDTPLTLGIDAGGVWRVVENGVQGTTKRNAAGQAIDPSWTRPRDAQIRQAHFELGYGQRADKIKVVAKVKPYFRDDKNPRLMDWYRVFGVAIASARPNEMCDIKIGRQSM
jgi:hypothetical protein